MRIKKLSSDEVKLHENTQVNLKIAGNTKEVQFTVINDYEFTYDKTGNITRISGTGNTTAITQSINCEMKYDAANRLICYNDKEITYDADGNMLQGVVAGEVTTLKYDCRNRLTEAGGTTYKYNAENI
ncbi:MAG: hypothetical protein IJC76_09410 [Lachnospiraceae bacterium]|nr:hypothetical protein [Lachnospiraceae bacterium]